MSCLISPRASIHPANRGVLAGEDHTLIYVCFKRILPPCGPFGTLLNMGNSSGNVRFGICTDVHKDIMHDADARLQVFVDRMNQEQVDFILQLGDFCRPYDDNRSFMQVWESFAGQRYHVLGNHDTDGVLPAIKCCRTGRCRPGSTRSTSATGISWYSTATTYETVARLAIPVSQRPINSPGSSAIC